MYGQEMIFLLDSAYLFYQNEIYNFNQPIISRKGKYLIPVFFLENVLPQLYPKQIQFNTNFISAELPIDNSIHRIVLDPGHGGKDPGAVGYSKKNYEKDVALAVARKLKRILLEQMSVEVYLTREKDEFVSLQKRTKFANEKKADLFISIHCNAARKKTANGIEVYFLSTAKTDDARAVEALENDVVFKYEGGEEAVKQYDDLAFILADMAQSEYLEESYNLSMRLQNDLIRTTESRDRGVKQANFYVLRGAFMPAVLIELGFLSNKEEEKKLTKSSYQNKLAQSIYESIRDFKKKYDQLN
ncbi:MAG TPA: N-acetylmuramoyl-L-alanine amidase [Candidatus Cloacimonetes bacterium]|nr:N-acetylmuramoyl-L-alanine amidase [Candidatus Cloacimonadota bacterium]